MPEAPSPKSDRSPGCTGCAFVVGLATTALLYLVLPWAGVNVPLWPKLVDGALFVLLMAVALRVDRAGR